MTWSSIDLAKEMAMNTSSFDENDDTNEDTTVLVIEANPTTKLARRRKIEDLFEEKRLKEELEDYA